MTIRRYDETYESFDAEALASALAPGSLGKGLNACIECCDRHAEHDRIALNWIGADGTNVSYTYRQLVERSAQFANFLRNQGVNPGDCVSGLLPRIPELLFVILGTWRAGAVYQPLFTAFGPKAIEYRLSASKSRLVVTDQANRQKLSQIPSCPPILVTGVAQSRSVQDKYLADETERLSTQFEPILRCGDDGFLLMFTSGTTGQPKGVSVPLKALLSFLVYMRDALDLRLEDAYWNMADPGWAYGLYYAVVGPLLLGHSTTLVEGAFSVDAAYEIIRTSRITNLAGAPTAYRMIVAAGEHRANAIKGQLRVVSSAGEPLNQEVIRWFRDNLNVQINDHYGQTEVGMILCNHHGLDHAIVPGSAGMPMPGFKLVVLNNEDEELPVGEEGILAIDTLRSPLFWFNGYLTESPGNAPSRYYRTGDTVRMNAGGSISFVGRADDIITSSGYRIGPFDVESALLEHPAVAESAVIGKPDPDRTEIVKAFVVLTDGYSPSDALAHELQHHVRQRYASHAFPREVEFVRDLPKTPSGKIQRFMLRQAEIEKSRR